MKSLVSSTVVLKAVGSATYCRINSYNVANRGKSQTKRAKRNFE